MKLRCPQCQSVKVLPQTDNVNGQRPSVPASLLVLVLSGFLLLTMSLLVLAFLIFSDGVGLYLLSAWGIIFAVVVVSALFFWKQLPDFKIQLQQFMGDQKNWKCTQCGHGWQLPS